MTETESGAKHIPNSGEIRRKTFEEYVNGQLVSPGLYDVFMVQQKFPAWKNYRWAYDGQHFYMTAKPVPMKKHPTAVSGMIDRNHNGIDDRLEPKRRKWHRRYLRLKRKSSIWRL